MENEIPKNARRTVLDKNENRQDSNIDLYETQSKDVKTKHDCEPGKFDIENEIWNPNSQKMGYNVTAH